MLDGRDVLDPGYDFWLADKIERDSFTLGFSFTDRKKETAFSFFSVYNQNSIGDIHTGEIVKIVILEELLIRHRSCCPEDDSHSVRYLFHKFGPSLCILGFIESTLCRTNLYVEEQDQGHH